jgi:hypothetical protein
VRFIKTLQTELCTGAASLGHAFSPSRIRSISNMIARPQCMCIFKNVLGILSGGLKQRTWFTLILADENGCGLAAGMPVGPRKLDWS